MTKNNKVILSGGYAVGEAMRQINPDVVAVYPITPQTPIVEYFSQAVADGRATTEIIPVESEHSAMSACIGASATGARVMTASSSQGILYMLEVLPVASAMRLPIVMAVANRAISGPINIHGDHSDAMVMRDLGWVQIFAENVQEAYDLTFLALKLAEKIRLPATINLDGFFVSHSVENLELLTDWQAQGWAGKYQKKDHLLDFETPKTFGALALPNAYFQFRKQIFDALETGREEFSLVAEEFFDLAERKYDLIEKYKTSDAEKVIVAMGSVCGTIKEVVDKKRAQGEKVGLLKITLFRPFPFAQIKKALKNVKEVIVLDRHLPMGSQPVLKEEIQAALGKEVRGIVFGLGGREVFEKQIEEIFDGQFKGEFLM